MIELTPYRPGNSGFNGFRPIPKGSPFRWLAFPLIMLWWVFMFFFWFFRVEETFVFICGGMILLLAGTLGMVFLLGFLHKVLVDMRLGTPVVRASSEVIQRGDELRVVLQQPIKSQVALNRASIKLVRHEWVKYTQGTDTYTDEHDEVIDEAVMEDVVLKAGETLTMKARFFIPDDAMHNFQDDHNRIQWVILMHIDINAWPDYFDRFDLRFPA